MDITTTFIPLSPLPSFLLEEEENEMTFEKDDFFVLPDYDKDIDLINDILKEDIDLRPVETTTSVIETKQVGRPVNLCKYKSLKCPHPRALRKDGTMLRLCEYHRKHQNEAKKRSDIKLKRIRSLKRQQKETVVVLPTTTAMASVPVDEKQFQSFEEHITTNDDGSLNVFDTTWTPDDVEMLLYYMF